MALLFDSSFTQMHDHTYVQEQCCMPDCRGVLLFVLLLLLLLSKLLCASLRFVICVDHTTVAAARTSPLHAKYCLHSTYAHAHTQSYT